MAETKENNQNLLEKEKSPYLLQHKSNPVNWHPWGEAALTKAKKEDRPIFLSIGYSTCYWCHVMEKESFEDKEVADALNKSFISIKVDREERPDVDGIYMDFIQGLTGRGGWPMSVFLNSNGEPFHGGTYFTKPQFLSLLAAVEKAWSVDRDALIQNGKQFREYINNQQLLSSDKTLEDDIFTIALEQMETSFDPLWGGFGSAPKFPPSMRLRTLLRISQRGGSAEALKMVENTLDKMSRGGIYDQLGGGFHRYSVDKKWLVPHFEKMTYDNALLACTYLEAFQLTQNQDYAKVASSTLDYVLREMTSKNGGFYSAQDAGEVGAEGEFYVWSHQELKSVLDTKELKEMQRVYGVTEAGNFENNNILNLKNGLYWDEKDGKLISSISSKLLALREKRIPPHKDDKILTAWNGLMIEAFAKAYRTLGEDKYLKAAKNSAKMIKENLYLKGRLLRRFRDGEAKFDGYLNDYAFLIQALISLFEACQEEEFLNWAIELQEKQDSIFWDEVDHGYFFTSDSDSTLIVRQKEYIDGALPAANGVAALNLLRLNDLSYQSKYKEKAELILTRLADPLNKAPQAFASFLLALDYRNAGSKEVTIIGNADSTHIKFIEYLNKSFLPNISLSVGTPNTHNDPKVRGPLRGKKEVDGKTTVYVCESGTCKTPTTDITEAKKIISKTKTYLARP